MATNIVNLNISIQDFDPNKFNSGNGIIKKYEELRLFLGKAILTNSGEIKSIKKYDSKLIVKKTKLELTPKLYGEVYFNGIHREKYFLKEGKLFFGYKFGNKLESINIFGDEPLYNLENFYKKHGISKKLTLKEEKNVIDKINFLENFLFTNRVDTSEINNIKENKSKLEKLEKAYLDNL